MVMLVIISILSLFINISLSQYCSYCSEWSRGIGISSYENTNVAVKGNSLRSNDWSTLTYNKYNLKMQPDGNLVLYDFDNSAIWSSGTNGRGGSVNDLVIQPDGNLVIYKDKNNPLWSSNTNGKGKGPYCLMLQKDRNLVIYDSTCSATWSPGTQLKDREPDANGNCKWVRKLPGKYCADIADENGISVDMLERYNNDAKTWKWKGCKFLFENMKLCVTKGKPPMPDPVPGLQCGMESEVKGKRNVTCPLNVCCSRSGYCGTSSEFCSKEEECQSNCEMGYKINSPPRPGGFINVGYFESWSVYNRPCLNANIDEMDLSDYTHVHYGFLNLDPNGDISLDQKDYDSFNRFSKLNNVKKIMSFGGWAFSDPGPTQKRFTEVFSNPDKRNSFKRSLKRWINEYNLDGVDIDWEYPGAAERNGSPNDADDYLTFVKDLRSYLPTDKSISIAAPASYWFLREFKIKEMSEYLDYIVYMTYDLHGLWDYDVKNTIPLLKSHVNWTETMDALTMITKAGVPSNKVLMGIGWYGRSFKMENPNCSTPNCKFIKDPPTPGQCTQTAGFLAWAEIKEKIDSKNYNRIYYDNTADSDVMIYNNNEWVAYTTPSIIDARLGKASRLNVGGFIDWAIGMKKYNSDFINGIKIINCEDYYEMHDLDSIINIPKECQRRQLMVHLIREMKSAIDNFNSYDKSSIQNNFNKYSDYIEMNIRSDYMKWLANNLNKYFSCKPECPKDLGISLLNNNVEFNLINNNFYNDINKEFDIDKNYVSFENRRANPECEIIDETNHGMKCVKIPGVYWSNFPDLKSGFAKSPVDSIDIKSFEYILNEANDIIFNEDESFIYESLDSMIFYTLSLVNAVDDLPNIEKILNNNSRNLGRSIKAIVEGIKIIFNIISRSLNYALREVEELRGLIRIFKDLRSNVSSRDVVLGGTILTGGVTIATNNFSDKNLEKFNRINDSIDKIKNEENKENSKCK